MQLLQESDTKYIFKKTKGLVWTSLLVPKYLFGKMDAMIIISEAHSFMTHSILTVLYSIDSKYILRYF